MVDGKGCLIYEDQPGNVVRKCMKPWSFYLTQRKKQYRLRFCWNSQKWSFRTISRRRFWLEINRGPLLLKPSFWKFWFFDIFFSKIKFSDVFSFFDFALISLLKWSKKSKTRFFRKSTFFGFLDFRFFDFVGPFS